MVCLPGAPGPLVRASEAEAGGHQGRASHAAFYDRQLWASHGEEGHLLGGARHLMRGISPSPSSLFKRMLPCRKWEALKLKFSGLKVRPCNRKYEYFVLILQCMIIDNIPSENNASTNCWGHNGSKCEHYLPYSSTNTVVNIFTKKIVQGKFKRELQTEGRGMGE